MKHQSGTLTVRVLGWHYVVLRAILYIYKCAPLELALCGYLDGEKNFILTKAGMKHCSSISRETNGLEGQCKECRVWGA